MAQIEAENDLDFDDIMLMPLTDGIEEETNNNEDKYVEPIKVAERPPLPPHLQKRKKSIQVSLSIVIPAVKSGGFNNPRVRNKFQWRKAARGVMSLDDPWEEFHLEDIPTENCKRYRYNATRKNWVTDTVQVKMQSDAFNRGAMRACFRLKKLVDGKCKKSVINYVAKRYIDVVDRDVYFEDVKLQMDAKLWAEEYNRHNPPKKVDIFQMCIIEFIDRDDNPLYHLEHFIEGDYVKYNSNSGFVEHNDEANRCTPHALSHFTFERSGHSLIVVDIQGVGDLYTDPQIHTADGEGYGDGNLGTKGMALFFHSHQCNHICKNFCLQPFDLSSNETTKQREFIEHQRVLPQTVARSNSIEHVQSPSSTERRDLMRLLKRSRSRTYSSQGSSDVEQMSVSPDDAGTFGFLGSPTDSDSFSPGSYSGRNRNHSHSSDCECGSGTVTKEEEKVQLMMSRRHRPSTVHHELNLRALEEDEGIISSNSVLGNVHLDLAKYHELGRFNIHDNDDTRDWDSAAYHLQQAAYLGILEAIVTLARIHLNLPHDILQGLVVPDTSENTTKGFNYMNMAARAGDRASMIFTAKAYETGVGLPSTRNVDWNEALNWYQRAVGMEEGDESGMFDSTADDPNYQLLAKQAELYRQGGHGLKKWSTRAGDLYNEAAEEAMSGMKGKLANKFYMLAEECYGEEEEEEEEEGEENGFKLGGDDTDDEDVVYKPEE